MVKTSLLNENYQPYHFRFHKDLRGVLKFIAQHDGKYLHIMLNQLISDYVNYRIYETKDPYLQEHLKQLMKGYDETK